MYGSKCIDSQFKNSKWLPTGKYYEPVGRHFELLNQLSMDLEAAVTRKEKSSN